MRLGHRLVRAWIRGVPVNLGRGLLCRAAWRLWGPAEVTTDFGATFLVDPRDTVQRSLFLHGVWEPRTTALFREVLRPGDAVVDVGANVGYHALLAARLVGPGGAVLAFEPGAATRALLADAVRRNGATAIRVREEALAAAPGSAVLHLGPVGNRGAGSLRAMADAGGAETVRLARGDEVIPPDLWDRVRLVKIDVEGAESAVIEGLTGLFARRLPPFVVAEVTDRFLREMGSSEEALLARMAGLGYSVRRLWEPPAEGLRQYDAVFEHGARSTEH